MSLASTVRSPTSPSRCTATVIGSYSPGVAKARISRLISSARGRALCQMTSVHGLLKSTQPRWRSSCESSGIGSGSGRGSSIHFSCCSGGRKKVHSSSGSMISASACAQSSSEAIKIALTTHLLFGLRPIESVPVSTVACRRTGRCCQPPSICTPAVALSVGGAVLAASRASIVKSQTK